MGWKAEGTGYGYEMIRGRAQPSPAVTDYIGRSLNTNNQNRSIFS